jgi:hypothetical protein
VFDWPITHLILVNQWTPYVAAAFVIHVVFTFAYHIAYDRGAVRAQA